MLYSPLRFFDELIVMYLGGSSNCTAPPAHLLCTSWPRCTRDVHIHQTILMVLMAKMVAAGRSLAAKDIANGVGWVYGWLWGDAEVAGHGFGV